MKPIVLDTTTKKLQLILSAAPATTQPDWVANYADANPPAFVEGSSGGTANGTTAVDIVASPAASTRRVVSEVTVYNADTATVTAILRYNDNGTIRVIARIEIGAGNTWSMANGFSNTSIISSPSKIANIDYYPVASVSSFTGVIPVDNTIPQISEGSQLISRSYTPLVIGSTLLISVSAFFESSAARYLSGAIFRDSVSDAIGSGICTATAAVLPVGLSVTAKFVTTSLTPITFTFRVGQNTAGASITFNGITSAGIFNGTNNSSITITEVLP